MDIVNLLISLISGAVGGNAVGAAAPDKSLGAIGNSIAGLIGGSLGGYILTALNLFNQVAGAAGTAGAPSLDITEILANIGSSGIGGALLTFIVGYIKNATQKT